MNIKTYLAWISSVLFVMVCSHGFAYQETPVPASGHEPSAEARQPEGGFTKKKGFINNAQLKLMNRILAKNLPRTIDFEDMDIDIWPLSINTEIKHLTLSENSGFLDIPAYSKPWAVKADNVMMRMSPLPLLWGSIHVRQLIVQEPLIQLAQKPDGELSIMDMVNGNGMPLLSWMKIKQMLVHDGKLRFYDQTAPSGPADLALDQLEVQITDFTVKKDFGLRVNARLPGADGRNLNVVGRAGPLTKEFDIPNMNLDLNVALKNAPIEPYLAYLPKKIPAYPKTGKVDFYNKVTGNLNTGVNVNGKLHVRDVVLASSDNRKETEPFDVKISLLKEVKARLLDDFISFEEIELKVKNTSMYVAGRLEGLRDKMTWDVNVKSDNIVISDIVKLNPLPTSFIPPGMVIGGTAKLDAKSRGNLDKITASGTVDLTSVMLNYDRYLRKQPSEMLEFVFDADIDPLNYTVDIGGRLAMKNGELLAMNFFSETLDSFARKTGKTGLKSLAKKIDGLPVKFDSLDGKVKLAGSTDPDFNSVNMSVVLEDLRMRGGGNTVSKGHDVRLAGTVNINSDELDVKATVTYSPEVSSEIKKQAGQDSYSEAHGRAQVHVAVTGNIEHPRIKVLGKREVAAWQVEGSSWESGYDAGHKELASSVSY